MNIVRYKGQPHKYAYFVCERCKTEFIASCEDTKYEYSYSNQFVDGKYRAKIFCPICSHQCYSLDFRDSGE